MPEQATHEEPYSVSTADLRLRDYADVETGGSKRIHVMPRSPACHADGVGAQSESTASL
jgi:hypothetical protein